MKFLLSVLLALPIFGQLLRLPLFDRMGMVPSDILVLGIVFVAVLQFIRQPKNFFSSKLFLPTMLFFSWAFFSLILNIGILSLDVSESVQAFAYFVRYAAYYLLIFIFAQEIQDEKNANYFQNFLFVSAGILAILGFLQLQFFPSFYDLRMNEQGWDPHIGRLLSTWFDPNFLGGYFSFILALLGGVLWEKFHKKSFSFLFFVQSALFVLLLSALIFTFSRSAYLAFLVAGFVFALFAERKLILIGTVLIAIMLSVSPRAQERVSDAVISAQALFTQTEKTLDPTARLRLQSWEVGMKLFEENPITGVGFNTLKTVQKREWSFMTKSHAGSGIDASILTVAATTGVFGVLLYLWGWVLIGTASLKQFFETKDGFSLGFFAGLCGIFVHAIFVNTLFFSLFLPTLFVSTAIILKRTENQVSRTEKNTNAHFQLSSPNS